MSSNTSDNQASALVEATFRASEVTVVPGVSDTATARLTELHGFSLGMIPGSITALALGALPDDGQLPSEQLVTHVQRIASRCSLGLVVDIDNGYGDCAQCVNLARSLGRAGAAAVIIEDSVTQAPGGHSQLLPPEHLEGKIEACKRVFGASGPRLIARTNARATGSLEESIRRLERYRDAGADGVFLFRPQLTEELLEIHRRVGSPQIAVLPTGNKQMSETWDLFQRCGVKIALIPALGYHAALGAFDAVLQRIRGKTFPLEVTAPTVSLSRLRQIVRPGPAR